MEFRISKSCAYLSRLSLAAKHYEAVYENSVIRQAEWQDAT